MGGFWHDVDDVETTVQFLKAAHNLRVECMVGHSRGGQVVHMHAAKYPGVPRIIGAHMRFDLEYWRATWKSKVQTEGRRHAGDTQ